MTEPTGWGDPPAQRPALGAVRAAARRLRGVVARTPLLTLGKAARIRLKPENLQPTGSFKVRGVFNWALSLPASERSKGCSTFSAGNTALALAFAARRLSRGSGHQPETRVACRSMLPDYAPRSKVEALLALGVETVLVPFDEMASWLLRAGWRDEPYAFLHPWTEPLMIAGHGTIGLELLRDCPDVERVYVPVGGGALAAGVGSVVKALAPKVRVVGVQTESCPSFFASFQAGRPVWIEPKPTVCDGVAVPFVTDQMYPLLREVVDEVVLVPESLVEETIQLLAAEAKLVVEGAGALAVAAALTDSSRGRSSTVAIVTGGSIGLTEFARILAHRLTGLRPAHILDSHATS